MVSAGLSECLGTDNHVSKSMGSEHDCKSLGIAWVWPFRSAEASARAGSIQAASERPAQTVIRRVDCAVRRGTSVTQGAKVGPKRRDFRDPRVVPAARRSIFQNTTRKAGAGASSPWATMAC